MLAFGYGMAPPYLTYYRVSKNGELVQVEEIEVPGATMVHDFNVTRNYVIFMDLPAVWNLEGMTDNGLPIVWDELGGARLGVMPRNGAMLMLRGTTSSPAMFHPRMPMNQGPI